MIFYGIVLEELECADQSSTGIPEDDRFDLPDSYLMAMEVFDEAEEYENELTKARLSSRCTIPGKDVM